MPRWYYWIPDVGDERDDGGKRFVNAERACEAAEKAAEDFHYRRSGWEWRTWPLEIHVVEVLEERCERGGPGDEMEEQIFEIDRIPVPTFEMVRVVKSSRTPP